MEAQALLQQALKAREGSYSPYSHYAVGAALECADGRLFCGANVENASYGLTMCAERNAVFSAVNAGCQDFSAIAVCGSGADPSYPCGACLQVLSEFAPDLTVYVGDKDGNLIVKTSVRDLLPAQFALSSEGKNL
jgi:cytidine deaminase